MARPIGVAVIGCGGVSAGHFSAYAANPRARLVAAVDIRPDLAETAAARWGAARWHRSVAEALADPEIQVVDLCLPHDPHAPVALQAAAGKHVFVEKPIGNTLDEADSMIAACERHGVLLMGDQTKRYQNRHQAIKNLLDENYLGPPLLVKAAYPQDITCAWRRMDPSRRATYWKHDGVIAGIGTHVLDLLRWLVGEVREIQAVACTSTLIDAERRTDDSAIMLLRFENGRIGEVTVSYVLKDPLMAADWDLMPLQIYGPTGSLRLDEHDRITLVSEQLPAPAGPGRLEIATRPPVGAPPPPLEGMAGAIEHLLDCIESGKCPLTDGRDARRSLELVEADYRSLAERRAARLPLAPAGWTSTEVLRDT